MYKESNCPRFAEQMDRLVCAMAVRKCWSFRTTVTYIAEAIGYSRDSVYRWRRGERYPRQEEILEQLVEIGKEAGLDRAWGESLLRAGRHPFATRVVEEIWEKGSKDGQLLWAAKEENAARLFEALLSLANQQQESQSTHSYS